MSENPKSYPKYKDSGIPWIGEVPEHWEVLPHRAIFNEVKDQNHPEDEMLSVTIIRGVIRQRVMLTTTGKKDSSNLDRSKYKRVMPSDIAYNKMRAWQGAFGVSRYQGIISPAYVVMRLRETKNRPVYFHHLFRTPGFTREAERWSYGITSDMWSLRPEDFKQIYSPLPPPAEQVVIAKYLAHATARIDAAIAAKKKIIALLEEEKRAIIQKAVTKGLDPKAKMKDSGVPWIGEIPEGWTIARLKNCISKIEQGWSPQCDSQKASATDWGVLKVGCVNNDKFDPYQNKRLPSYFHVDPTLEIHRGDILVSRANTHKLLGLAALVEDVRPKLILSDKLFRFYARDSILESKFLVCVLRSNTSRAQIERFTNGASSSMQNIGQSVLKNLWISFPDIKTQMEITRYIDQAVAPLSSAEEKTNGEISLLREYRTRLVSDVVTGKLDVREAAKDLPDLSEDLGAATAACDEELESEEEEEGA